MGNRSSSCLARLSACLIILCFFPFAFTQSNEKPKLKDFGSSLKRIKWDPDKKAAVEIKANADSKTASDDLDVVRVETSLVTSDLLVLDTHGNPVSGLTDKDFLVTEDGKPQQVGMFSLGDSVSVPRSIVLIIDYSGSLLPYINMSVEAAKTLVDQLGPRDRMAVVTDDVKLLADFTQDKQDLKSKLESLKKKSQDKDARGGWFHGHSLQFSALMATLREMFDYEDQRPVIIFQTDGDELRLLQPPDSALKNIARSFSINDVYKTVEKSGVTIYTVIPGLKLLGLSEAEQNEQTRRGSEQRVATRTGRPRQLPESLRERLSEIVAEQKRIIVAQQSALAVVSTISGGWASFLEDPSQANEIYSCIFSDINRRYIVGYYPTNKEHDGKRRKLDVTVRDHPDYIVMGRKAYYAPGPDQ